MGRRSKGRRDQYKGTVAKWTVKKVHIGWKGYVELPRGEEGKRKRTRPIYRRGTSMEVRQALEKEVESLAGQLQNGVDLEVSSRSTLQQYLVWWLQDVAPLSVRPITLASYESKLRTHVYDKLGKVVLVALKPAQLTSLYSNMLRSGLSKRTVQYVHAILRKALTDAVEHRLLQHNVARGVKAPKPDPKEATYIPPEKIPALCDAIINDWLYPLFYLAMASGLRRGELCALRWNDIDWNRGKVRVDESCQELSRAQGGIQYGQPKSKKGRRSIIVPEETMDVLRAHRKMQAEQRLHMGPAWKGEDFVFTSPNGAPLRPSVVSNHWRLIRKRVGVEGAEDVVLHGLRHTHATLLLLAGIQPKVVMDRLGHSTTALGQDIYSHVIKSMEDEVAEKLSAIMPKSRAAK
jgi:integrase